MLTDVSGINLTKEELYGSKPEAILRLAAWLKLDTTDMGHDQICRLIYWRLTRDQE